MEIHNAQSPLCPPENDSTRECVLEGWISVWAAGDDQLQNQVELSRKSSQPRILALAAFLIDQRGRGRRKMPGSIPFNTAHYVDLVPGREADVMGGHAVRRTLSSASSQCQNLELSAVPYYTWANRGSGTMRVWLPNL
jgi:DUF1680 family protein